MKKYILIILILFITTTVFANPKTVVPGVTLERFSEYNGDRQVINVARIDLSRSDIHLEVGLGDNNKTYNGKPFGKESVSQIVEKSGALLGVNADFFIMEAFRDNLNFSLVKGEIISEPQYNRSVMFIGRDNHIFFDVPKLEMTAFMSDGTSFKITGINRNRNAGDIILYTDKFAPSTLNKYKAFDVVLNPVFGQRITPNSQITYQVEKLLPNSINNPIEPGKVLLSSSLSTCPILEYLQIGDIITLDVRMTTKEPFENIVFATGGGPMLVQNGSVNITSKAENFKADIAVGKAPRTAVGLSENGKELILVTVDGRTKESTGMTLETLAKFMQNMGAYNAMNLDGGGSTTMSVLGLVMNYPSGIVERNVANALLCFSDYKGNGIIPEKNYEGLTVRGNSAYWLREKDPNAIFGTRGGVGFVDSENVLWTTGQERVGKIGLVVDGIKYEYDMEISNAPLSDVIVEASQSETEENVWNVKATLLDKNKNPMALTSIFIYAMNGALDDVRFVSDEKGEIFFNVLFYPPEQTEGEESLSEPVRSLRFVFGKFSKTITF
ncbi:MAG: phosphodiester glycosidase family protein [Abditibacteriota bacterium]|nr:phosphodiester glycosidase family protein [Abditibacteriota bacterium]